MAAESTYTPIATTTLGSAQATVSFNSFSGYTDLILVVAGTVSVANNPTLRFNSDSTSNYSWTYLVGAGSGSGSSGRGSNQTSILTGGLGTSTVGNIIYHIQNYSNSTTYKTVISRHNRADDSVGAWVGLWRKTPEAITTIDLGAGGGNWNIGSTFTLYGIQAA